MSITANDAYNIRENCNKAIDLMNRLNRLEKNTDFKKLMDEYLDKEPVRLAKLYGDATLNMDKNKAQYREDMQEALIAIGRFDGFLRTIHQLGLRAKDELDRLNTEEIEG